MFDLKKELYFLLVICVQLVLARFIENGDILFTPELVFWLFLQTPLAKLHYWTDQRFLLVAVQSST